MILRIGIFSEVGFTGLGYFLNQDFNASASYFGHCIPSFSMRIGLSGNRDYDFLGYKMD